LTIRRLLSDGYNKPGTRQAIWRFHFEFPKEDPMRSNTVSAKSSPKTTQPSLAIAPQPTPVVASSIDEKAYGARKYDPRSIAPTQWRNRDARSYSDSDYLALLQDMRNSKGNLVPILIRPVRTKVTDQASVPVAPQYEIAYGHRRHRACLDLGLPVLAIAEEMDDPTLLRHMLAENEMRKNLSAWELGTMFKKLLKGKVYRSQRQLAKDLNRDPGDVSRALRLVRLPAQLLQAIQCPLQLALHDADLLGKTLKADPEGVQRIAAEILKNGGPLPAKDVLRRLVSDGSTRVGASNTQASEKLILDGRTVGQWKRIGVDALSIKIDFSLTTEQQTEIRDLVLEFAKRNVARDAPARWNPVLRSEQKMRPNL
jgi:ParB family chromosome partitioning protein